MNASLQLPTPSRISTHKTRFTFILSSVIAFVFPASLITSLFLKEKWLWMDETTSITLLSDPSFAHLMDAVVSALDAHPPLFFCTYWPIGHFISLNPYVLKIVSIGLFTTAVVVFYRFTTRLVKTPIINFFIFTAAISLTYLNYTLATQIRSYCLFLLMGCLYLIASYGLIHHADKPRRQIAHVAAGTGLIFVHNFGAIYITATLCFFGLLFLWSRRRTYLIALASHGVVYGLWLLIWYPKFDIQAAAGQPYSWIPLPTFVTFFRTVGELVPAFSSRIEHLPAMAFLPVLRVCLVVGLFLYIAIPRLKQGFASVIRDPAFCFYLMGGFVAIAVTGAALILSFGYMSVWLSRFQWPSELLLLYQLAYAWQHFFPTARVSPRLVRWLPAYVVVLTGFMVYQSQKISLFPSGILTDLPRLNADYPVFFESADYFLPIWHHKNVNAYYLLNRETALAKGNLKNAAVDYNILHDLRAKYDVPEVIPMGEFNKARFPHFYVVDESSRYLFEDLIAKKQVRVVRVLPVAIKGHQILECIYP